MEKLTKIQTPTNLWQGLIYTMSLRLKRFAAKPLQYRNFTLPIKIVINHLILLIIPVIFTYFWVFQVYSHEKRSEALNLVYRVNRQAMENIDNYLQDLKELTKQPLYEPEVLAILTRRSASEQQFKPTSAPEYSSSGFSYQDEQICAVLLNRIMAFKPYIHSVFIFDISGRGVYRMKDNILLRPFQPEGETWFRRALAANGSPLVSGSFRFRAIANAVEPYSYLFSVSRAILDTNNLAKVGIITLFADNAFLRNICNKTRSFSAEQLLIVDKSGKIVYGSEEINIARPLSDPITLGPLYRKIQRNQAVGSFTYEKRKYLTNVVKSQASDWQLIRIIPEDALYSSVRSIQQQFLWLTLLFVCLSLVLSVNMSYRITKPLQKLMLTMNRVQLGDLTVRFKAKYYDEVGHLGRSFNRMITQIDHLINRVHVSELRKQQAELNALQAQINPHFIYNTLESIRMQAELNDDTVAAKMIALLGNLLRYSVSKHNPVVTLGQELTNLQNYMQLQQYRFQDRYQLIINVPSQLLSVRMIKLLLQPLVENAIYHGMQHSKSKGYITITGSSNQTGICLEVHDNGSGIPSEQLKAINDNLNNPTGNTKSGGLGLTNVNERIKLTYGSAYGIRVWSKKGQGTTVTIQLPPAEIMNSL